MHFVDLPKFIVKKPRRQMTKFEKWLYVLKFGELYRDNPGKLPAVLRVEEEIVMAIERMREAAGDAVVRELMEARQKALHDEATWRREERQAGRQEGLEQGLEQGLERGLQQGVQKGLASAAQKMREAGMSREEVAGILGIPVETL